VYNLQTESGQYVAGGIITHNCECSGVASIDTEVTPDAPDAGEPDVTAPDASQGDVPSDTDGSPFTVQDDGLDLTETAPDVEP
jgi:hypothetical protein